MWKFEHSVTTPRRRKPIGVLTVIICVIGSVRLKSHVMRGVEGGFARIMSRKSSSLKANETGGLANLLLSKNGFKRR